RLDRQPLLQPRVARDVEALLAELLHAARDDVLDLARVDPRAVEHLGVTAPEEVVRMDVLVVALLRVPAPDRRAHGLDDDDLSALLTHGSGSSVSISQMPVATNASAVR